MRPPAFLANSCDGSNDPICVIYDPRIRLSLGENNENILFGEGPRIDTIFLKINDPINDVYGCFQLVDYCEFGIEYNVTGSYSSCDDCEFSQNFDNFKSNVNVVDKYNDTKETITNLINGKTGRGRA